ncbi:hypothetical protein GXY_10059 [Novacetimonas hansenii ATCC 23769]|uniref:Uncharacterized protein n=1 Tax=Novacetimonas hansenii ATCC 23769 TaxID=714995 RepID=D5QFU2_NOVHA|nr:hypothetical protein GXY_10059 [Novacetimonas hansenii ATCC 23769]
MCLIWSISTENRFGENAPVYGFYEHLHLFECTHSNRI